MKSHVLGFTVLSGIEPLYPTTIDVGNFYGGFFFVNPS